MLFWQLQYRSYPKDTQIESFSFDWDEQEIAALRRAAEIWGKYGTNILSEFYKFKVKTTEININQGIRKLFSNEQRRQIIE
jgi:hypothetical protein